MDDFLNFDSALEVHDSYGDTADSILESILNKNVDEKAAYSCDEDDAIDDFAPITNPPSYFEASFHFKVIFNFLLLYLVYYFNN